SMIAGNDKPALVFVVSTNQPSPDPAQAAGWPQTAAALAGFGGNQQVFLGLNGSGDYALVGLNQIGTLGPNQGVELSQAVTGAPSPRITGPLTRNRQGLYEGRINGPPNPVTGLSLYQNGLQQILAQ